MGYDLTTENGYNMYDMSSMLQKAIRRGDIPHAGYAATEMFGKFRQYTWRRLLEVSAEDCFGIITKEIVGAGRCNRKRPQGKQGVELYLCCESGRFALHGEKE